MALKKPRCAFTDLLPIILVVAFFQLILPRQPLPHLGEVALGTLLVVTVLSLFIQGLEIGLFPVDYAIAHALTRMVSVWLASSAFCLSPSPSVFSSTVQNPLLLPWREKQPK